MNITNNQSKALKTHWSGKFILISQTANQRLSKLIDQVNLYKHRKQPIKSSQNSLIGYVNNLGPGLGQAQKCGGVAVPK